MGFSELFSSKEGGTVEKITDFFSINKEIKELKNNVQFNQLTDQFVATINKHYDSEALEDFKPNLKDYITTSLTKFSVRDAAEKIGLGSLYDVIMQTKNSLFGLFSDSPQGVIDEYIACAKTGDMGDLKFRLEKYTTNNSTSSNNAPQTVPGLEALDNPTVQAIVQENNIVLKESPSTRQKKMINISDITYHGTTILKTSSETPYFNALALPDLVLLASEFYDETQSPLVLNSPYRTYSHQQELRDKYENEGGNLAAKPGESNHNLGLAIDVSKVSKHKKSLDRFQSLAKQHNFNPLASEDWHFDHIATQSLGSQRHDLAQTIESQFDQDYKNVA